MNKIHINKDLFFDLRYFINLINQTTIYLEIFFIKRNRIQINIRDNYYQKTIVDRDLIDLFKSNGMKWFKKS